MKNKKKIGFVLFICITIIALVGLVVTKPIIQDLAYHDFADNSTIFGIPNFWNVVSNLPFLIIGILAIIKLISLKKSQPELVVFFAGVALVSIGSGYYHYNPTNDTLVWDRLPMTIAFMGLFAFIIKEFIHRRTGKLLLIPLILIGIASIIYWVVYDDLRLYAFVQFYPIVLIPVILIFFGRTNSENKAIWLLLFFYLAAKIFEYFDAQSYIALKIISGHSIKHFLAALGIYLFFRLYFKRIKVLA